MHFGRTLWRWAWRLAVAALILWQIVRNRDSYAVIPFVIAIAAIGVLFAGPILDLVANWFYWARKQPYEKWQGNYYEFANIQIRIFEHEGALWFCDADVMRVIGLKPTSARLSVFGAAERRHFADERVGAFSEAGVRRLLGKSLHADAAPMLLWIEREVLKPHRRRLELAESNSQ